MRNPEQHLNRIGLPADRGDLFPEPADTRAGTTLVELLVVLVIVAVIAVSLSVAIASALTMEQNYREESAVRTKLALQLDYAERYLSLASEVTPSNSSYVVDFRHEAGGVSFETGHWVRVQSSVLSQTNALMNFSIVSDDERKSARENRGFYADGMLRVAPAVVSAVRVEGANAVRRLVLEAEFPVRTRDGIKTNSITVSRPVRLWNWNEN